MTSEEARKEALGSRRLPAWIGSGRFPVRLKLVAVLFLPMTLLVVLATLQVLDVQRQAREAQAEGQFATAVTGQGSLLTVLIDERNWTGNYLAGTEEISGVEPGLYLESRDEVDQAAEEFQDFIEGQDEEVQEIYAPALEALSGLREMRADVDAHEGPRSLQNIEVVEDLFERFDEVTGPLFDANQQVSLTVNDPALRRATAIVDQTLRQFDNQALLVYLIALATVVPDAPGLTVPDTYVPTTKLLRDMEVGDRMIRLNAEGDLAEHVEAVLSSEYNQEFSRLITEGLETGEANFAAIYDAITGGEEGPEGPTYSTLRALAEDEIDDAVAARERDARLAQALLLILGLPVLAVVGVTTILVARSITRPLRALTRQAMSMANERLPQAVQGILETPPGEDIAVPDVEPIDIRTRDEVSDVTQALNTVQDSALKLAVEQAALRRNIADSFVNLGRRNQALLGRQLDFITQLEHNETNPDTLGNLFRLDHLATRMRRNAESLLVLAGIEPPHRWTAPVLLTDVIRAALGEVENYERVTIQSVEPATIVGSAAADLAHLLAELIENALTFSPPHQSVEVRGRYTPVLPAVFSPDETPPDQGVYTLTVIDGGVGMRDDDIARANRRLAGRESFTIAPSKFLGHYVAGMIAVRHSIDVRLHSAPRPGLTATLELPPKLLSSQEAARVAAPTAATPTGTARPANFARILEAPSGTSQAAVEQATGKGGNGGQMAGSRASAGLAQRGERARGQRPMDTYRMGDIEFHIDRGTSFPAGQATEDPGSYAQLIQRVQGAQMPTTKPVSVPRPDLRAPAGDRAAAGTNEQRVRPSQVGPRPELPAGDSSGDGKDENEHRARHVHNFLSSFSTGVKQGRDAAARGDHEKPPVDKSPEAGHSDQRE